jgi:hypothetical protein
MDDDGPGPDRAEQLMLPASQHGFERRQHRFPRRLWTGGENPSEKTQFVIVSQGVGRAVDRANQVVSDTLDHVEEPLTGRTVELVR